MFGVILWSDAETGSAVIWCEQRAELAYFKPGAAGQDAVPNTARIVFDAGDLVEFDTCQRREQRLEVCNLRAALEDPLDVLPLAVGAEIATPDTARPFVSRAPASVVDLHSRRSVLSVQRRFSRRG